MLIHTPLLQRMLRILFLITIPVVCNAYSNENSSAHPNAMPCKECHLSGKYTSAENASLLLASQPELCVKCHAGAMDIGHPYDLHLNKTLPGELPPGDQNKLTCSTCHNVHGKSDGYLRTDKRGLEFCLLCHNQDFFLAMKDQGLSLITSTHINTKKYNNSAGLDNPSIQCLGCHGENSYSSHEDFINRTIMHMGGASENHQIGVIYASYQSYGGYRAQNMLPENIILPDGKLSCVSCHQAYSQNHGSLVMSNSGSALCYSCHDL